MDKDRLGNNRSASIQRGLVGRKHGHDLTLRNSNTGRSSRRGGLEEETEESWSVNGKKTKSDTAMIPREKGISKREGTIKMTTERSKKRPEDFLLALGNWTKTCF